MCSPTDGPTGRNSKDRILMPENPTDGKQASRSPRKYTNLLSQDQNQWIDREQAER